MTSTPYLSRTEFVGVGLSINVNVKAEILIPLPARTGAKIAEFFAVRLMNES